MPGIRILEQEVIPQGEYIAFARGSVHRDEDGKAELTTRNKWRDGKQVDDEQEVVARFGFVILYPEAYRGEHAAATASWGRENDEKQFIPHIKVQPVEDDPDAEFEIRINKRGSWICNLISFSEEQGVDWATDFYANMQELGEVTDAAIWEAIDRAVLQKAKEGRLVMITTNDRGWVDGKAKTPVAALPAHMLEHVKHLKAGVDYEVSWPYDDKPTRQSTETAVEYSREDKVSMVDYLRTIVVPALTEGESRLTDERAKELGFYREYDGPGRIAAQDFAKEAQIHSYDSVDNKVLAQLISLITGAKPVEGMLSTLSGAQLSAACTQLPIISGILADKTLEPWMSADEVKEVLDGDVTALF